MLLETLWLLATIFLNIFNKALHLGLSYKHLIFF